MELYLVRHAIAEDRDAVRWPDDAERPLTAKGAASFGRAARGLRRIVPEVDVVLSSPYARAWQTAEILQREAGWPAAEPCDALEALRAPDDALDPLRDRRERGSVVLVGHEPNLSLLASLLLTGDADALPLELKKGAVALLAFAAEPAPARAVLRWSMSPKLLRALAP
jgi:phosphohistidine phosphatase